jgi:hypothetical protein
MYIDNILIFGSMRYVFLTNEFQEHSIINYHAKSNIQSYIQRIIIHSLKFENSFKSRNSISNFISN